MKKAAIATSCVALLAIKASAISISIEYENPSDSFFTASAQSTLAKAAADLSNAITTSLSPLSQDVYTGTSGASSASVNWALRYRNPTNDTDVTLDTFSFAADEVKIRVGSRGLTTNVLGVGGAGAAAIQLSGVSATQQSFNEAVSAMEIASDAGMGRGGPILNSFSGTFAGANFNLQYGYAISSLAFDNDGSTNWHFDYGTAPGASQTDFYSVAIHEILHSLGVGGGSTWSSMVSGTDWTGPAVIDYLGSGTDAVASDGGHIASGLMGKAIIDGVITSTLQEVSVSPSIAAGTRRYVTDLDLAFLSDMGYAVIPEPSSSSMLIAGSVMLLLRRRRSSSLSRSAT